MPLMLPDGSHQQALAEIESRIGVMERRLRNARAARDSYVDYLRNKYPNWRPHLPTYRLNTRPEGNIVGRMATSDYHWDMERNQRPVRTFLTRDGGKLYDPVPRRGPFLESDVRRTKERLSQISEQLKAMNDNRIHLTTEDYFRTKAARIRDDEPEEYPSLVGVRQRLSEMTFSHLEPPMTPTADQMEESRRREEREKMLDDVRAGKIPSVLESYENPYKQLDPKSDEPAEKVPVDSEKTENMAEKEEKEQKQESSVKHQEEPTRRTISFGSTTKTEQKPSTPPEPVGRKTPEATAPTENSYSRMMDLLTKKDTSSDSDDDVMGIGSTKQSIPMKPTKTPPGPTAKKPDVKPAAKTSLSMYLSSKNGNDSSSSDDIVAASKKQAAVDSDSDFFG